MKAGRRHKNVKGWEEEGMKKKKRERKKEFRGKGKKKNLLLALNRSG